MPATSQQTEAIELIGDWAKWIAAVETGAIAAIGALAKPGDKPLPYWSSLLFGAALVAFVASIVAASVVLLSLPAAVQDIEPEEKVWDRTTTASYIRVPLWKAVGSQFVLFALGIVAFGIGVIFTL